MPEIAITSREQWLELRRDKIGASEVAALFGLQPSYAPSLWTLHHIKAGLMDETPVIGERPEAGLLFESAIAQKVVALAGLDIQKTGYWRHPRIDGLGCTPDYLCMAAPGGVAADWLAENNLDPELVGNLEIKNVDWLEHRRSWSGSEPSAHILLQDQTQKACIECDWGLIGSCVGGNSFQFHFTTRRAGIVAEIEARVIEFWRRIRDGELPPVDGSKNTARALAALYPDDDGEPPVDMTADNELSDLCTQWMTARDMRRQYERAKREAGNRIMAKLGEHRSAVCNSWIVSAPTIAEIPDRHAEPEEIIKGRRSFRRLDIKEQVA